MSDNYKTMTLEEIKALNIKSIADENAFIFLWTTHTFLPKAFELLTEWGFKYHLTLTWDKRAPALRGFRESLLSKKI
ncbi:MT-A70 family methyltransferase [Flavobacterium psychrophilum]|uniref:MT-A70 family methyltransferase n=1 Tax=Flavobacterium psychrophilum TaxID=96345 RepID=UPI003984BCC8